MKILKLVSIITIVTLINGCGISDIGSNHTDNLVEDNASSKNTNDTTQIDENITQLNDSSSEPIVDNTPIVIHDGTGSSSSSNQTVNDQTNTTSNDSSSSSVIIDPNACDLPNYISDDGNDPQGVQKDGVKFTQKLSNAGEVLTFYYEKSADEKATLNAHLGDFYDNNSLMFSLSINEAYFNKGYFYIKNEYTGKCYRGSFPPNEMTPPNKIVQEVSKE